MLDLGTGAAMIDSLISSFLRQCEVARDIGIPAQAVAAGHATVPPGWVLDPRTQYFLPPNVILL